jgi:hypothetical protein
MGNYEVHASPFFVNVTCPKHRVRMAELENGFIGEKLWYCPQCDRPYRLNPQMLRKKEFDPEELDKQLKERLES